MATIFPSLLSADPLNIEKAIKTLDPHVYGYHIDVMDGHFVPNLTWGPPFIKAIAAITSRKLWIHLMVTNPLAWLEMLEFLPGGSIISFHHESEGNTAKLITGIEERHWYPSIAISPRTSVDVLFPAITNSISHVLLMSVEPGFAGQDFIKETIDKLKRLVGFRETSGIDFKIGMDGGINKGNIVELVERGVDDLAIASGIFKEKNPVKGLENLQKMIKEKS